MRVATEEILEEMLERTLGALRNSPCENLLLQYMPVRDTIVTKNCAPCHCWRAILDSIDAKEPIR